MKALLKAAVAALPLLLAVGCGPPWAVIRQGTPNPLTPQTQFAIDNSSFNNLQVGKKTEADYLAVKKPEQQQSWQNDKMAFIGSFSAGLQERRGPLNVGGADQLTGRFNVKTNVDFLEPGNFNGFVNIATEMRTTVVITDPNQQPIDEIQIRCVIGADIYHPAVGMRVAQCGRITGQYAARYLKTRVGLK